MAEDSTTQGPAVPETPRSQSAHGTPDVEQPRSRANGRGCYYTGRCGMGVTRQDYLRP